MDESQRATAELCLQAAERGDMTFPQIVGRLIEAGFESYLVDFRREAATYYQPDGSFAEFPFPKVEAAIAPAFDAGAVQVAIREAQTLAPGYTYRGFCRKVAAAGCAFYLVSFSGRRAVYFGRTGEAHVEMFPPPG